LDILTSRLCRELYRKLSSRL